MRPRLLFAVLLLAHGAAFAQAPPPVSRPDSTAAAAPAPAVPDTLAALHRLFASRRQRRNYIVGGTALATVAGVAKISASKFEDGWYSPTGVAVVVGFLGGVVLGSELAFFGQYSRKKEQRAVEAFTAHELSPTLKQKLKPAFFR